VHVVVSDKKPDTCRHHPTVQQVDGVAEVLHTGVGAPVTVADVAPYNSVKVQDRHRVVPIFEWVVLLERPVADAARVLVQFAAAVAAADDLGPELDTLGVLLGRPQSPEGEHKVSSRAAEHVKIEKVLLG